jgi:hypothetical protein
MERKDSREPVEIEFGCINPRSISDDHYVPAQDEKYIDGELIATRKVCGQAAGGRRRIIQHTRNRPDQMTIDDPKRRDASNRRERQDFRRSLLPRFSSANDLFLLSQVVSTCDSIFYFLTSVRFGSKADMCGALAYVRFGPKADVTLVATRLENSSCCWAPLS